MQCAYIFEHYFLTFVHKKSPKNKNLALTNNCSKFIQSRPLLAHVIGVQSIARQIIETLKCSEFDVQYSNQTKKLLYRKHFKVHA